MRIALLIASYLAGSIPAGYLLVRLSGNTDVRELGEEELVEAVELEVEWQRRDHAGFDGEHGLAEGEG